MAVYAHYQDYPPQSVWADVIGDSYTGIAAVLILFGNSDGTRTRAEGDFGLMANGTIFNGEINTLTRVGMDGTIYEDGAWL